MAVGEVEKMVAVGLVWGATNAAMRRGALIWDRRLRSLPDSGDHHRRRLLGQLRRWAALLSTWQYTVPFLLNLSASAAFFALLPSSPISLAVPVTNSTTFAATAFASFLLGEEMRLGPALLGELHQLPVEFEAHWVMLMGPFHLQHLGLNLWSLAMKGALFQSILTRPPLVAQSSAFQRLE